MQGRSFDRGIEQLQRRVNELRRRAEANPAETAQLLSPLITELATALEELRVAHEELSQRQERLLSDVGRQQTLLEGVIANAPVGIALLQGPEHRYALVNPVYGLFTRGKGDVVGRTVAEAFAEIADFVIPLLDGVYQTGEPYHATDQPLRLWRDGRYEDTFISFSYTPWYDDKGKIRGVLVIAIETTEAVRARQRIEGSERALADQAQLLDAIVENTEAHLVYLDRDFNFVRVNSAYAKTCGYTPEQMVGMNHFDLYPHEENEAIFRQVRDTGEPFQIKERPFVFPDQPERGVTYWDWTLVPLKDQVGDVTGLVFSLMDVTEKVKQREQIAATERARVRMAEAVAAEVNHRMKNNLAMVAGLLQLQVIDHEHDSPAAVILQSAMRRLMAVAVVHEQLYETKSGQVNVADCVRHIGRLNVDALMPQRPVELSVEGELVEYPSKSGSMVCVIANELITNAIKYGGAGNDGKFAIKVRLGRDDGTLRLAVWNSGKPVPEGFDPLEKRTLGLRLVHDLANEQYGGTLSVRPEAGGTMAEVLLDESRLVDAT